MMRGAQGQGPAGSRRRSVAQTGAAAVATIDFPVVAIGASAGEFEVVRGLLGSLPASCGMAFLIQRPEPASAAEIVELLSSQVSMPIVEASDAERLEPDHVYVIPPGRYLGVRNGRLRLARAPVERLRTPLDLLQSAADELAERTASAILNAAASDVVVEAQAASARRPLVHLVDDDEPSREATSMMLRQSGLAVVTHASSDGFQTDLSPVAAGCLLIYDKMPGAESIALLDRLNTAGSRLPAIVVMGNGDVRSAVRAMKAGAVDVLEKPVGASDLLASIDHALEQNRRSADGAALLAAAAVRLAGLTERQRQVLELVLDGQPSKVIAVRLGISQRTVETHRATIMRKTGSKTLTALVRTALAAT
jgi:FixJ family two-component response regulator